jgi:hypothetical protein
VGLNRSGFACGRLDDRGGSPVPSQWLQYILDVPHTLVVSHLQLRKVVADDSVVGVIPVVVRRPPLLGRLADAVHLVRLRGAEVLALGWPSPTLILRIAVLVVLVNLSAVQLLGEVVDPAGNRLLRLLEALLNVLADLGKLVCVMLATVAVVVMCGSTIEEAVLSLRLTRSRSSRLPLATRLRTALAVVVLRLELAAGLRARWLRRGRVLGLEVWVRHACAG